MITLSYLMGKVQPSMGLRMLRVGGQHMAHMLAFYSLGNSFGNSNRYCYKWNRRRGLTGERTSVGMNTAVLSAV